MPIARLDSRALISVTGEDAKPFLHNLLTQDVETLAEGELRFGALLSPPGRLLFDLFILGQADGVLLDVATERRDALLQRLSMYKLRAKVQVAADDRPVFAAWPEAPAGFISDPRTPLMGGRLWLESLPGQGATFFVELPMPAVAAPPPSALPPPAAAPAGPRLAPLNILLCEDTELNVLVFEAMLLPLGHRVDHAENGLVGLHKFRSGRYDLVLMDVQMPGLDGLSATRELRRIEREDGRARTPVIALTANAFDADAQRSLDAGCDAHLTKPISQAELLEALGRHGCPGQGQVLPDSPTDGARPAEFRH